MLSTQFYLLFPPRETEEMSKSQMAILSPTWAAKSKPYNL